MGFDADEEDLARGWEEIGLGLVGRGGCGGRGGAGVLGGGEGLGLLGEASGDFGDHLDGNMVSYEMDKVSH